EGFFGVGPGVHVGLDEGDVDLVLGRERTGLGLRSRREVDRENLETLAGKPDAVAPFAVGDGQRRSGFRQQRPAGAQDLGGLLAEGEVRRGEAFLPVVEVRGAHDGMRWLTTPCCSPSPPSRPHKPRRPSAGISPTSAPCPVLYRSRWPRNRA